VPGDQTDGHIQFFVESGAEVEGHTGETFCGFLVYLVPSFLALTAEAHAAEIHF
jgi:hypothetical protein